MSSETVIKVDDVSKAYTIWSSPSARLHGPMLGQIGQLPFLPAGVRAWCGAHSQQSFKNFYALKNISFTLARGESVGIIGRNGSGKSTLLQIIAGTLMPTEGDVTVHGSVAALLELGSGFNPEFTGRENVYMNAAIRGMTRAETDAKFDEIAAFADIGDFIDQPTKTYSSGMLVRLAFAVSVCVEPEVLIVDEALSVGDVFFSQKCFDRIRALREAGTTLLFVSHDTAAVANLCERAIWLEAGRVAEAGGAEAVVRLYLARAGPGPSGRSAPSARNASGASTVPLPAHRPVDLTECHRFGNREVLIAALWLGEDAGAYVMVGDWVELTVLIAANRDVTDVSAGFEIRDRLGQVVCGNGLRAVGQLVPRLAAGEQRLVRMRFQCLLAPGKYTLDVGCGDSNHTDNASDRVVGPIVLTVTVPPESEIIHGIVKLPSSFEIAVPTEGKLSASVK